MSVVVVLGAQMNVMLDSEEKIGSCVNLKIEKIGRFYTWTRGEHASISIASYHQKQQTSI